MKKLLYLLTGILLTAIILPSCNSSLSITKRRYTKGYFVQHIHGKQTTPAVHEKNRRCEPSIAQAEEEEAFRAVEYVKPARVVSHSNAVRATAAVAAPRIHRDKITGEHGSAVELAIRNPVKALKIASKLTGEAAAQNDALSLLWILIVVILIVYILGIINDGFGFGELIHILGAVILALLILWLLRIL